MKNSSTLLFDCLQRANTKYEIMQQSLLNIFANTINKDFGNDLMYKHNLLGNIKMAIGEELYNSWVDQYKN